MLWVANAKRPPATAAVASRIAQRLGPAALLPLLLVSSVLRQVHSSHHWHRYALKLLGALVVAIWCAAVANASPSVAYFRFPLTGHFSWSPTMDHSASPVEW